MKSHGRLGLAALAWMLIGCTSLLVACGDDDEDDDGGGGTARFACEKAGDFCVEYYGSSANVDAIRDASDCEQQGAVEVDACPTEGAAVCSLTAGGNVGTSQFYYGLEGDDIDANRMICESFGGTFTAP